jgi:large subunit ribosomal protein L18
MKLPRRRRLEKKTDYKARFNLLKSGSIRLVTRKTNRYILAQIVETSGAKDKVLLSTSSKDLLSKGWPKEALGSLKSLQASYLTGFMLGKRSQTKKIKKAVLDIGMQRNVHKSRLYSLLKGALDSGLEIEHNPEILPTEKDLEKNENLYPLTKKIKEGL